MNENHFAEAVQTYQRYAMADNEEIASYAYLGKFDDAVRVAGELQRGTVRTTSANIQKAREVPAALALVYALQGKKRESLAEIAKLRAADSGPHFHHQALLIAAAYAEMGMAEAAVSQLEFCARNGMPAYSVFKENPSLKKLAGNATYERFMAELKPRFEELARRVKP